MLFYFLTGAVCSFMGAAYTWNWGIGWPVGLGANLILSLGYGFMHGYTSFMINFLVGVIATGAGVYYQNREEQANWKR
jgi:hypothetical protein